MRNKERSDSTAKCQWCGYEKHDRSKCPASHATCKFCGGKGHFQSVCIKKQKTEKRCGVSQRKGQVEVIIRRIHMMFSWEQHFFFFFFFFFSSMILYYSQNYRPS